MLSLRFVYMWRGGVRGYQVGGFVGVYGQLYWVTETTRLGAAAAQRERCRHACVKA